MYTMIQLFVLHHLVNLFCGSMKRTKEKLKNVIYDYGRKTNSVRFINISQLCQ